MVKSDIITIIYQQCTKISRAKVNICDCLKHWHFVNAYII